MRMKKEDWFKQKHEYAHNGIDVDCEMCIYYEDFFAPREGDFDAWCDKRNDKIKDIDKSYGCQYFDMGDIDDWDY